MKHKFSILERTLCWLCIAALLLAAVGCGKQLRKAIGASARLYRSRLCRLYLLGLRGPKNRGSSGNRT